MANLRSQVILSTLTMVVVGSLRPAFNAVNTQVFGADANGQAVALLSLIFLASLPATAGLPSLVVLQVSRALGAQNPTLAQGHAGFGALLTFALSLLGLAAALIWNFFYAEQPFVGLELFFLMVGVLTYGYWRLARSLFVAVDQLSASLRADLASMLVGGLILGLIVFWGAQRWAVAAFISVYGAYGLFTWRRYLRSCGPSLPPEQKKIVLRYLAAWSLGTTASLATQEVAVLLLRDGAPRALVGEFGVALSFLTPLAFAPRVLELPLLRELSRLGGENQRARQAALTGRALHWLNITIFTAGFGVAFLAEPLLGILGGVQSRDVFIVFALLSLTFSAELIQNPVSNLVAAEAPPRVMALFGVFPFLVAVLFWLFAPLSGLFLVAGGLMFAHVLKVSLFSGWAAWRYGVNLLPQPVAQLGAGFLGLGLLALVQAGRLNPYLAALGFGLTMAVLFFRQWQAMAAAVRGNPAQSNER